MSYEWTEENEKNLVVMMRCAIGAAWPEGDVTWRAWAQEWLDGKDRTEESAALTAALFSGDATPQNELLVCALLSASCYARLHESNDEVVHIRQLIKLHQILHLVKVVASEVAPGRSQKVVNWAMSGRQIEMLTA